MRVAVNGEERELEPDTSVADLLQQTAAPADQIAVAVNGDVVPRRKWEEVALAAGDRVEIVTPIQGGGGTQTGSGHG